MPEEFADRAGVVLEDPRAEPHLVARVDDRLADALYIEPRELLGVVADRLRDSEQDLGAAAGFQVAPRLLERAVRAADGGVGVAGGRGGDFVPVRFGRRVDDRDPPV